MSPQRRARVIQLLMPYRCHNAPMLSQKVALQRRHALARDSWRRIICGGKLLAAVLMTFASTISSAAVPPVDPALRTALESALSEPGSFTDAAEAQVWLLDYATRLERWIPDATHRTALLRTIHREAQRANVPPEMVLAVIEIESAFDSYAISSAGALGLMQVMPFWTRELGRDDDNLLDIATNLRYGTTILAHYLKREDGNWTRALNRYNGKLRNNPYAGKVLEALRKRWFQQ